MIDIKKAVAASLSAGALIITSFATPAFAATTLQISGNGSSSDNTATVDLTRSTTVVQDNNADITNNVSVNSNTGGNRANDNTGGDVRVDTGNARTDVTITNKANKNLAVGSCCGLGDADVTISGNGSSSDNTANLNSTNTHSVFQTNDADVRNWVDIRSRTGDNDANRNTGGDVTVRTGSSDSSVDLWTAVNRNAVRIGLGAGSGASSSAMSLRITGNGSNSDNDINLNSRNSSTIVQDNNADVTNRVGIDSKTGRNRANDNTGGDVRVDTGDALADVVVTNKANQNLAALSCGCALDDLFAKISGNGSDSDNDINANLSSTESMFQTNDADLDNNLRDLNARTGDNDANRNTGPASDDVAVSTGNADSLVDVLNSANLNAASSGRTLGEVSLGFDLGEILAVLGF